MKVLKIILRVLFAIAVIYGMVISYGPMTRPINEHSGDSISYGVDAICIVFGIGGWIIIAGFVPVFITCCIIKFFWWLFTNKKHGEYKNQRTVRTNAP